MNQRGDDHELARRRRTVALGAFGAVALVSFIVGVASGAGSGDGPKQLARSFSEAWEHGDYARMYGLLDSDSQQATPASAFRESYLASGRVATTRQIDAGAPSEDSGDKVTVPTTAITQVFGRVSSDIEFPYRETDDGFRIVWSKDLTFPGLESNEQLSRKTTLGTRASISARDGTRITEGPDTVATQASLAELGGELGPIPPEQAGDYESLGYPPDATVGISGLQRLFQRRVAGRPGGTLFAGSRQLVKTSPVRGVSVRSTIDPDVQDSAAAALEGRFGGVSAMDPRTGQVLALAGFAISEAQAPGSTFKIITTVAALEAGKTKLSKVYPIETAADLDGYKLANSEGESCGGTFVDSFAHSCNSVFAPLGVEVGPEKLVATAEKFGFNQPAPLPGSAPSTIPAPEELGDTVELGSTAIGQGQVVANSLQMADVAATIAENGKRPIPTLELGRRPKFVRVTTPKIARQVEKLMVSVVEYGTGTKAALNGVKVAGKTGTAELGTASGEKGPDGEPTQNEKDTDAWFVAYAPIAKPRIAVGILLANSGAGGDTAAPAAAGVLLTALKR